MVHNHGYILLKNKCRIIIYVQLLTTKYEAQKIFLSSLIIESNLISNQKKKQKERSTVF